MSTRALPQPPPTTAWSSNLFRTGNSRSSSPSRESLILSAFGGITREYQVKVDPDKLIAYGLSIGQVEQQLTNNNTNAGGNAHRAGLRPADQRPRSRPLQKRQGYRGHSPQDPVQHRAASEGYRHSRSGTQDTPRPDQQDPLQLRAESGASFSATDPCVNHTDKPGSKQAIHHEDGKLIDNEDVVEGIVLMQKGDNSDATLEGIHQKVDELNNGVLPPGVKIVPFLDRSELLHYTTHTVLHNLTEGIILVVVILFLFLGNARGAVIVAVTIPFALLFAAICLNLEHIPANLLSLGALYSGMVVDGSVVMVENIVRHLSHGRREGVTPTQQIREAAEVQRPVFFARGMIITAYLPIFTLQAVEGRLFKPMAWMVTFALLGALVFSLLLAPVLSSLLFPNGASEWQNPVMTWLTARYRHAVKWAIEHRNITVGLTGLALLFAFFLGFSGVIGSEFLPHLDEGSIWVRGTLAPSTGPTESLRVMNEARLKLAAFPEVLKVVSQTGRPDDGTDTTGFFNTEYFVDLKPKSEWRPVFKEDKDELIAAMDRELEKTPGSGRRVLLHLRQRRRGRQRRQGRTRDQALW